MAAVLHIGSRDARGRWLARAVGLWDIGRDGRFCAVHFRADDEVFPLDPGRYETDPADRLAVSELFRPVSTLPMIISGDIVVAGGAAGYPDAPGSIVVRLSGEIRVAAHNVDCGDLEGAALPILNDVLGRDGFLSCFDCAESFRFERDARVAAAEQDEAIVWAMAGGRDGLSTRILAHRGSFLFWEKALGMSCRDVSLPVPPRPGLWLYSEGKTSAADFNPVADTIPGTGYRIRAISGADALAEFPGLKLPSGTL